MKLHIVLFLSLFSFSMHSMVLRSGAVLGAVPAGDYCAICLEFIQNKYILEPCNHEFCNRCIGAALKHDHRCPMCRNGGDRAPLVLDHSQPTLEIRSFRYVPDASEVLDLTLLCSICREEKVNPVVTQFCFHTFCEQCLSSRFAQGIAQCPDCGLAIGNCAYVYPNNSRSFLEVIRNYFFPRIPYSPF